jgi:hypothetical protein
MPQLIAALSPLTVRGEHAVDRPLGAQVRAFVEQRGTDLGLGETHEPWFMQAREDGGVFVWAERPARAPPCAGARWGRRRP